MQFQNFAFTALCGSDGAYIYRVQKCGVFVEKFPLGGVKSFDRRHVLIFSRVEKSP